MLPDKSIKPYVYKKSKNDKTKVHKFKLKWWHILIAILLIVIIAAIVVFANVSMRLNGNKKMVNNWNQLLSQVGISSATSEGGTLNDSDFDNIAAKDYPIIKVSQKDPNVENILFIGIDGGDPGEDIGHRSDSMIVVSINTKNNTIKMTSILRDIKAYFPERKAWGKLNASYAYGGAGQVINIINYNFKLDIQKYVLIDFSGFKKLIDTAGGVDIKVTAAEATQIAGLSKGGTYTLTGAQALDYARIRYIDSDFVRTQRQRTVILSLYDKFKDNSVIQKTAVINEFLNYVKTNIPTTELMGKFMSYSSKINTNIPQLEVPTEDNGMYTVETSPVWYFNLDWDKERKAISDYIYNY